MTYRKCFSINYIFEQFRRFWWVSALYFVCLFFALPFRLLVRADEWKQSLQTAIETARLTNVSLDTIFKIDFFNYTNGAESLAFIVVPLLITALIFSYLNKKSTIDTIHSLPITRRRLYFINALSGFLLYTLPIIVIAVINAIIISALRFWPYIGAVSFFSWVVNSLIFLSMFFVLSIFFALCTGNVPAMVALTYFFSLLPYSIYALLNLTFSQWFYGFAVSTVMTADFTKYLSPFVRCFMLQNSATRSLGILEGLIYLLVITGILIWGYFLYRARKSESAGNVLAFKPSEPIVKYILMFCGTVLFGTFLYTFSSEKDVSLLILGYIIGAILSYMIVQSLIHKDVRTIKKGIRGMVIYIVIFLVFSATLFFDIYGYQKRVPSITEVKTVYFNPLGSYNYQKMGESGIGYSQKENIEIITNLHKQILNKKFNEQYNPFKNRTSVQNSLIGLYRSYMNSGNIEYDLKGGTLKRTYSYDFDMAKSYLAQLFASEEGKMNTFIIFNKDFVLPQKIEVLNMTDSKRIVYSNQEHIEYIISALKQDILNDPMPIEFENSQLSPGSVYFESVVSDSQRPDVTSYHYSSGFTIKPYYKNTIAALKSFGINIGVFSVDDISSLEITLNKTSFYTEESYKAQAQVITKDSTTAVNSLKITDPKLIAQVYSKLKRQPAEYGHYLNNVVYINVTLKNSAVAEGAFTVNSNEIPDFILEYFKLK